MNWYIIISIIIITIIIIIAISLITGLKSTLWNIPSMLVTFIAEVIKGIFLP